MRIVPLTRSEVAAAKRVVATVVLSWHCKEAVTLFRQLGFREVELYKESIGDCFMQLDFPQRPTESPAPSKI